MTRVLFQAVLALGAVGFFGAPVLRHAGARLDYAELPIFFETTTVALPDVGRLTATLPTQRIQLYDRDGRFVRGWFVDAQGGHFAIGIAEDRSIWVCTARGRKLHNFKTDGTPIGVPRACDVAGDIPSLLQPQASIEDVRLRPVLAASPPKSSFVPWLLVPLWHPFVALSLGLVGLLGLRYGRK